MKTAILCGITLLAAAPVFAQSSATEAAPGQTDTHSITMTGCVGGGGSAATPVTLTNAMVIPGTAQPGQLDQTPSPLPPTSSSPVTQPVTPAVPPPSATASPAPAPQTPVGTSGTRTPAPTGTSGVGTVSGAGSGVGTASGAGVGTASGSGVGTASGASGVGVTGTAPAGSSGSTVSGYQLTGVDMQPWIGKRVQVIGTFAPASASAAGGASAARQFRVVTVQPATGPCAK